MLIDAALLRAFNRINADDETLVRIHIGTAQQIISDYVGFDAEEVMAEDSPYTEAQKSLFQSVALRIATLLQLEGGGNIGVSASGAEGVSRSFLNVVDYTPYLKPLSAFRRNTEA